MELYIHTEDNQIISLPFSQEDTLQMIEERLKKPTPLEFCCDNRILAKTISLSTYQISNGAHIYAVSRTRLCRHQYLIQQFEMQKMASDKRVNSIKLESERLKDVLFKKVEGTSRYYRKVLKRYHNISKPKQIYDFEDTPLFEPDAPKHISSAPLPRFWTDEDNDN